MPTLTADDWMHMIESHAEDAGDGLWLEQLVCDLGDRIPAISSGHGLYHISVLKH